MAVDSVTVNRVKTDTLFKSYDSTTCDSLANVRIYLSKYPAFPPKQPCTLLDFDNYGNDRFVSYTCLELPKCPATDSLGFVTIDRIIDSLRIIDTVRNPGETLFVFHAFPETTAVFSVRLVPMDSLGSDSGSCSFYLHGMYDKTATMVRVFDTTVSLYWRLP
jgi:hypothetical protein